jgi:hypothetical protein
VDCYNDLLQFITFIMNCRDKLAQLPTDFISSLLGPYIRTE